MLLEAKRPMIYAGGGVILSDAAERLVKLARTLGYPVTNTLMGLGGYPATDKQWLGMLGMHGTVEANNAMQHCDVLLAVGARFDDRVIGNPKHFAQNERKIIHIDIDPSSISKRVKVDIPIVGDVKEVLSEMIATIREGQTRPDTQALGAWWDTIETWRKRDCLKYDHGKNDVIKPQYVVEQVYKLTKGKAIIATEVGQNQMWAAQFYSYEQPRTFLSSGGLGTMGYGLPAAIGAQVAMPGRLVVDIAGDGSIQMNIQELATAVQYRIPVKVVILNNGTLGMVRQWQELFFEGKYSQTCLPRIPDFVKLAEAYGAKGFRAEKTEQVPEVLRKGFAAEGPVLIDVTVDPGELVYPMVPAGASLTEMLLV